MASYSSYKKVNGDQLASNSLNSSSFSDSPNSSYGVKWFYGIICRCSPGCCCNWTVPTGVQNMWIQAWGSGGNGSGACSCNRCHHFLGAQGGYYNSKMITTSAGNTYSVCAGGVYPCLSRECTGCQGCSSYVNGSGLSNFCAIGGCRGMANTSWSTNCSSVNPCCRAPGNNGGDFGIGNHGGAWSASRYDTYRGWCHCYQHAHSPTSAPLIGTSVYQSLRSCWIRCGCWIVPYGHGGQNATTTYCGSGHCGQGGTGGGGLVKITYF